MKKQKKFVIEYLLENEYISRNFCLKNFISRLSAIIGKLNNEGWEIKGKNVKTKNGTDYVYTLISSPFHRQVYTAIGQEPIVRWERKPVDKPLAYHTK